MKFQTIDWAILGIFLLLSLVIGLIYSKKSSSSAEEFFLSGRKLPWWLLGFSMVATTFAADTPNLVTDIIRRDGISGNWVWWAFLLTGTVTVFFYAGLWRKAGFSTDLEFYSLRYSGKAAKTLRAFRAVYLGLFFNVLIMANVSLAAIKIGGVMFNLSPIWCVTIGSLVTVLYSSLGGLKSVIITDFLQFLVAIIGSVVAAYYLSNTESIHGLGDLFSRAEIQTKMDFFPATGDNSAWMGLIIIPFALQWWSVWYPGAEPGGGGYIVQRMLSAKDQKNAVKATLFFNIAHYALRPWPWFIVAFCSIITFPDLQSIATAFPHLPADKIGHDLAYPAMVSLLPAGLIGLVVSSLVAAYMSTISTHLNWGSSYLVFDFYKSVVKPEATEKELVTVGRISTFGLMIISSIIALYLTDAYEAFNLLLQIGAGTGLIFILRWFWWRINAWTEIAGMGFSFLFAIYNKLIHTSLGFEKLSNDESLVYGLIFTTIGWIIVTLLTKPENEELRKNYATKIFDGNKLMVSKPGTRLFAVIISVLSIYGLLFSIGYILKQDYVFGYCILSLSAIAIFFSFKIVNKLTPASK